LTQGGFVGLDGIFGFPEGVLGILDVLHHWDIGAGRSAERAAVVRIFVCICQFVGVLCIPDHVGLEESDPPEPPELRGDLFGQGQLKCADGFHVLDDGS
jgi:hypothetical protein